MSERVTMPALGESVTEGTVTRWLKSVGDTIEVDEPLLEVSTDKVDTEIPSPVAGTLQEILVGEDDTVPVGADLAVIGDGSGGGSEQPAAEAPAAEQPAAEAPAAEQPAAEAPAAEQPAAESAPAPSAGEAPAAGSSGGSGEGTTVTMPALGESVTEGTVTRWLKAEGDQVEVDEPLLEVSTDKVDTEIPSPVAGTLSKILVGEDETVPVGADLAVVGGSGAGAAPSAPPQEQRAPQAEETAQAAEPQPSAQASDRPAEAGSALEQEAAEHQQAAEQSLTEDKPRGGAPAAAPAAPAPARAGRRARDHVR